MATETLHPGRRIVLQLPLSDHDTVTIAVLDSATEPSPQSDQVSCAAMLVPAGEERNWIYTSEGGQWQLLAATAFSRMIIVSRTSSENQFTTHGSRDEARSSGVRSPNASNRPICLRCEDEALKTRLRSIVVALAPRICFRTGSPIVPFVEYSDNIIHRVVVEEFFSSLTGFMVVEDVALDDLEAQSGSMFWADGEAECEHRVDDRGIRKLDQVVYRRRLRFKRMPNLIQTEVALVVPQELRSSGMTIARTGIEEGSVEEFCEEVMRGSQIDHGWLVHKYLPPIVAGLVLAAPCIEPCMERGEKVKVLALGVGGGALPIFLQKQLGFHVQAVDVDKAVLDAAHRHFGLDDGVDMEVILGDALQFVAKLAMDVRAEDATLNPSNSRLADASPKCKDRAHASAAEGEDVVAQPCNARTATGLSSSSVDICRVDGRNRHFDSHRVHAIVVDVDEGDPRCGLSSPPSSFLAHNFLSDARTVLHEGGLVAMNVVPNGAKSYHGVVSSLFSVFDDVYETVVEGDVNRVVFALSSKGAGVNVDGPLARLVTRFLDVRLIREIQKAHHIQV
ncbi:hypothetical protein KC19_11G020600 [Ceratodon purpureus]|uniref:Methyltransferase-like protein 13 n=1 Tax=Ceratodon purpureus TaxID=3225 RepID=A0A8T0GBY9_CERPU|nr:hypothetical protein KC19_11G020600 [Ceratodon purpureus]